MTNLPTQTTDDLVDEGSVTRIIRKMQGGDEDGATPPELVRELAAMIPGAIYQEIDKAGHLPCIEQPQVVADAIGLFLKENGLA